jgi:CMP-N-acetylneuraminic acid synthetase
MSRLAIVPARGGSKRIPRKNIRPFCGRPMLHYVLETARASRLFDVVHVSTDSVEIADAAAAAGFRPDFPRPAELADDQTPLLPVLEYVLGEYLARGCAIDTVMLLMPCAPMLEAGDLVGAMRLFEDHGRDLPVIGVCPFPAPLARAYARDADGVLSPVDPVGINQRSQDLPEHYHDAGQFDIYAASQLAGGVRVSDFRYLGYVLPRHKAIDIDTPADWNLAEAVYRGLATMETP